MKNFIVGQSVVYPSHGVGKIIDSESNSISGKKIDVFVISFSDSNMILRIPINKAKISGLRHLCNMEEVITAYNIIKSKPKRGNRMWSKRAQEYESKINSGSIISIAEVIRDLYKNVGSDCSYSERVIYETAINRLISEVSLLNTEDSNDHYICELLEILKDKLAA